MEPDSLLRQPRKRTGEPEEKQDFRTILRAALEQFAVEIADDREAIETVGAVIRPLLEAYGEPLAIEQWRDAHGVITRAHLRSGGQEERGLLILDGMAHVLSQARGPSQEERWQLLHATEGLLLLAWKPGGVLSHGRLSLDHWRAAVRPLTTPEFLANYPVEAYLRGLQDALTRRVERSRQWTEFIRSLNEEFEKLGAVGDG